jgi:hypothetical protein
MFRAEIVFHGQPKEEYLRRQENKLAVSLSTISDVNVHDLLHNGDNIAIIDCQTFVPGQNLKLEIFNIFCYTVSL